MSRSRIWRLASGVTSLSVASSSKSVSMSMGVVWFGFELLKVLPSEKGLLRTVFLRPRRAMVWLTLSFPTISSSWLAA